VERHRFWNQVQSLCENRTMFAGTSVAGQCVGQGRTDPRAVVSEEGGGSRFGSLTPPQPRKPQPSRSLLIDSPTAASNCFSLNQEND